MSEAEKKQIKGVCEEISEKNGWTTFLINTGSQYPTRLSTKIEALISAGRAAGDRESVWTFAQSQGGENPNKPGTFYQNRRLEKVEVGGTLDPTQARGGPVGNAGGRSGEERHSIERQTIIKAAMAVFPPDRIKTGDDWFKLLDKLDDWMQRPVATAAPKPEPTPPPPAPESSGGDPAWPDTPDDEIPFVWIDTYGVDPTVWRDPWRR